MNKQIITNKQNIMNKQGGCKMYNTEKDGLSRTTIVTLIVLVIIFLAVTINVVYADLTLTSRYDVTYEPYRVKSGDTIYGIAKEHYQSDYPIGFEEYWHEIESYNNISNPSKIHPGDIIYIPTYTKK